MTLKKVVVLFSVFLVLLGLMDFTNRLTLTSVSNMQQSEMVDQGSEPVELNHIMLDEAAVKALLSWSDIKAVTLLPEPIQLPPPVVEPEPEALDQRQVVTAVILGDPSQYLLGDDLLALKGVFHDGKDFASVEIQNINSQVKRYITFAKGKGIDKVSGGSVTDYVLTEIGMYHVVLKKQDVVVKLQLFKRAVE